jgi:type II secretory pathway predicted ATPase ExeA
MNNPTMAEHFGWKVHPFADTWRPSAPFCSSLDKRITDQALLMLQHGKSFAVTGASGNGKSTLMEHLIATLDQNYYKTLHIHYGGLQRAALLKALAEHLGVETNGRAVPLLVKLQKQIAGLAGSSHPVYPVILVDDAQLLERHSFMDLCSLIVCPPKKTAAASLILVGDDMLEKQIQLAVMRSIRSRLTASFGVQPLDEKESRAFIAHRLQGAKAPTDLFEPDALALLAARCHGNRRDIMNAGTLLVAEAYCRAEKTVSAQLLMSCELLA